MAETNGVTYTVKELLAKIEGKLDGVIITIGQKADKHDVDSLDERVKALEAGLSGFDEARRTAARVAETLAAKQKDEQTFWDRWRNKAAWAGGLVLVAAQAHTSFPHFL